MKLLPSMPRLGGAWGGCLEGGLARTAAHVAAISILLFADAGPGSIRPHSALAAPLSAEQRLASEAWRTTDREFVDREFARQDWFTVRQKMVKQKYTDKEQVYENIRKMLKSLDDRYTRFLTPAMYDAIFSVATGDVAGVGVELTTEETQGTEIGRVLVNTVVPESPAERSGVRGGDVIVSVGAESMDKLSPEEVAGRVRGPPGSKVKLGLLREGEEMTIIIERAEVKLAAVTSQLQGRTGFVRIKQFSTATTADVKSALEGLKAKGAQSLVIDLRQNTGGYFTGGVDVARLLLPKDAKITTVTDNRLNRVEYQTYEDGLDISTPLYLLVDGKTASASEILSSALQDNGRAKLVGVKTFGKAVIQTVSRLEDGSGVVVTTARYETPKGTNINQAGIEVDVQKECAPSVPAPECVKGLL